MINERREQLIKSCADSEERLALVKVIDMVVAAKKQHEKTYSYFFDPIKAGRFYDLLSKEPGIAVGMTGGYAAAERRMLGVCPDYMQLAEDEFPIAVLNVSYNARFSRGLSHRDFLGSVMGLGIDRSRVGDIVLKDDTARVFVCREISGFITANLERVGSVKVAVSPGTPPDELEQPGRELRLTVASLRLDAVISAAFNVSRGKAAGFIAGEKVFVNWRVCDSAGKTLTEGDVVTVRGLGRLRLAEVGGRTKKDRLVLRLTVYS